MNNQDFQQLLEKRRSVYDLGRQLPMSESEVVEIITHAMKHSPSAFNSQSSRALILFGDEHIKLWDLTEAILKAKVDPGKFINTKQRIDGFRSGAGTVLFFEDQAVIKQLQSNFVSFADNFPIWSEHSTAINQYAVWLALADAGLGANLQHYNPLIDEAVANNWSVNSDWKLRAQMVFGHIKAPAGQKTFSEDGRIMVSGIKSSN